MDYAGFWKRFGAYWIDVIVFLPIMALSLWGNEQSRLFQLYWLVPGLIIGLWFHVYLVKTYGGTPGKLLLKIKIAKVDGSDVGYKEAMLRYSVLLVISFVMSAALIPVALGMTDAEYFSMGWQERALYMIERAPSWYNIASIAMNIWIWSEFIVMLTNKKRRALHDFIAGTVVIRKESLNKSSQLDASEAVAST
ncbi:RDD family protein [Paraferrimonas sp. SM1919]|uniref:RDD family protein n=1 Tax=Paraferrimonas sp. SM1919 TaxID=2662263 RepID=UPI0013D877CF|nr:RDD family protein [Paraferrimonas sp. SM1919]